ncbi:F-box/kelch-repeat protein At3g23880-like [Solanum dulcamara]|uniref:F-box/kelch-repeat protein At3g23880-like n=1 Tax=Solanum dulcamara TaxID=45834 RepID=UPI002485C8FF|nr:F-box/kelch-repeat protein At3g23880-like [Solanum dulcamara]
MSQQMSYLPIEVIFEILLRLPVKSIIKFKTVSKSWLSLLSSPQFVNTHLIFSRNNHKNIPPKLLLSTPNQNLSKKIYTLFPALSKTFVRVDLNYLVKSPCCLTRFIGSCDGLICLSVENSLILWNPSTRKWKKLPKEPVFMNQDYCCTYGFGYDEFNDDYKLVLVYSSKIKNIGNNEFKVYSLKTNSWKRIKAFVNGYVYSNSGVLLNGIIHWDSRPHCDFNVDNSKIVYFDLVNEKQGKLDLPSYDENEYVHWDLMSSKESLFGFCHCECQGAVDIWIMKEYGVKESWNKFASVPYYVVPGIFYSPLFMNEDGEVLLRDGERLVLFNIRKNIYKDLQIHILDNTRRRIDMVTYNESLVSPVF